jgi:hypothetical protein
MSPAVVTGYPPSQGMTAIESNEARLTDISERLFKHRWNFKVQMSEMLLFQHIPDQLFCDF